jgi:hypothetical protein
MIDLEFSLLRDEGDVIEDVRVINGQILGRVL